MVRKTLSPLRFSFVLISLAALASSPRALDWQSRTSFNTVRNVRQIGDSIYAATSGGVLAISSDDPTSLPTTFTNLDGLGTTDITDIISDADGQMWIIGFGQLVRFGSGKYKRFPVAAAYGWEIGLNCITDDGDILWLGSDSGLIQFVKGGVDDGVYQNRFRITEINPFPPVYQAAVTGDSIWIATANGLAAADKSNPGLLNAPSAWHLFNSSDYPELGTNMVTGVVSFEGAIYITTEDDLFRLDISGADTSFAVINPGGPWRPNRIRVEADRMVVYHSGGLTEFQSGAVAQIVTTSPGLVSGVNMGSYRWVAFVADVGLYENSSGYSNKYPHTGLPGDAVTDVLIDDNGVMTAGFETKRAVAWPTSDENYVTYNYSPGFPVTLLEHDRHKNLWIGTLGCGLWFVDGDSLLNYNDTNSTIVGNNDVPPGSYLYAIVTGVNFVGNYLYASVFRAYNGSPVAFASLDDNGRPVTWGSFGSSDGITDVDVESIDYHNGFLAIGSRNGGLFYYHVGPDPFDKSDDYCINYTTSNSFIRSNSIRKVEFSPGGELWAATSFGVCRLDTTLGQAGEVGRWVDVPHAGIGPDISALEFDRRGNAWIGAQNGLVRVPPHPEHPEVFTRLNSGLLDDRITALTIAGTFGDLYISTPSGLSILRGTTGSVTDNLDELHVRPNPFVISSSDDCLEFPFAGDFTVYVYNVAGEPVWQSTDLGQPCWDGRNQHGRSVASGVYLFVLKDAEGHMARGKFLLVRQ